MAKQDRNNSGGAGDIASHIQHMGGFVPSSEAGRLISQAYRSGDLNELARVIVENTRDLGDPYGAACAIMDHHYR